MSALNTCAICHRADVVAASTPCAFGSLVVCPICQHYQVADLGVRTVENAAVQLEFFGAEFARRSGLFQALYESINTRRTMRALNLARGSKVLEVGPGSGAVLAQMASEGYEVRGIDLSPAVAQQIRAQHGVEMSVHTLGEHAAAGGAAFYDAVIMRHVLEHFEAPLSALKEAGKLLRTGGKIYVAVPNMASWHSRFQGWPGYAPYHLHYFTPRSLVRAMEKAGFSVACRSSYESLSGWSNTILRSVSGRRILKRSSPDQEVRSSSTRVALEVARLGCGVLMTPVRWLQSVCGRGEELVVVAVKI